MTIPKHLLFFLYCPNRMYFFCFRRATAWRCQCRCVRSDVEWASKSNAIRGQKHSSWGAKGVLL